MKISIAMASYNGEKYISEQIESIIDQTIQPYEIIVSDDNSSDSTKRIVEDLSKKHKDIIIKFITNDTYHGVTGNFQNAAKHTTGDVVFFSDQDDVWYDNKIEVMLNAFEKYPSAVGAFCDADCVDTNLNKYNRTFNDDCWDMFKELPFANDMFLMKSNDYIKEAVKHTLLGGCCLAVKREYLKQMYDFCPNIYHDDWISFCMLCLGNVVAINKSLFMYRLHGDNTVGFDFANNSPSISKKLSKVKNATKYIRKYYVDNAMRAKYFGEFAKINNVKSSSVDYIVNVNKESVASLTAKKSLAIKKYKEFCNRTNKDNNIYRLGVLYILTRSKKRRVQDFKLCKL